MLMRLFQAKQNIVVYSAGDDGSAAIAHALKGCGRVRHVRGLAWKTLAMASVSATPQQAKALNVADHIMRHEMDGRAPLFFITMVRDPLWQFMDMVLRKAHDAAPNAAAHLVMHPQGALKKAGRWFEQDFIPATGIDVFANDFADGYAVYTRGAHKFLLLSAHLDAGAQQRIIEGFLGKAIAPIVPEPPLDGAHYLRCLLARRLLAIGAPTQIYDTDFARHVFTPLHINAATAQLHALADDNEITPPKDARMQSVYQAIATLMKREGAIMAPMHVLRAAGLGAEKLESEAMLLQAPYPLCARQAAGYAPRAKTVLYNPHQCLPCHTSGYATRTQGLVRGLSDLGWDMRVAARAGYPLDTGVALPDNPAMMIDRVPYMFDTRAHVGQRDFALADYISRAADYLYGVGQEMRPVILHTASNFICGMGGIEAARKLGIPSIYEMRGLWHVTRWAKEADYNRTDKFALAHKMELECAREADQVIAITGALKEWLCEQGISADKISLAPNAVDANAFAPLPYDADFAREAGCEGKIVIGYIGSFVGYEGLDYLLEAVAMLDDGLRARIQLLWVGDGAALDDLLGYASKLGVRGCISAMGRRPFEDMPRAYSLVDIAVFPRRSDVVCEIISPLKPFEALAMEKAVLVSSVRPLQDIITHGQTGLIHEKDNARDLADKLALLIADDDLRLRLGKAGREWVLTTRQWNSIAHNVADVYGKLI